MKKFIQLFNKVGGKTVLRQYAKNGVLLFAMLQTLLNGFSKKALELVRMTVDHKIYRKLAKKYAGFVQEYVRSHPAEACVQKHNPVIWTIWLQGMENAPQVVQSCYASMRKHITDRPIIVITEENFRDYVTFPDYIMEKYEKGIISKVHFSDLLRIELLANHGGTWLDGTVFCSGTPDQPYILDGELFLFQMLKPGLNGNCRAISSWLMTAHSGNPIILLTRALLHEYWRTHNYAVEYFILHDFMQMALEAYPQVWNKVVPFSSSTPHILLLRLFETYNGDVWEGIKAQTSIHKLTYKFAPEEAQRTGTYYDIIVKQTNAEDIL